jgi:asparagine synthase (glutamine-hydrolysing)
VSDFFLDFRPKALRSLQRVATRLSFAENTRAAIVDTPAFGLVITYTGDPVLWEPYYGRRGMLVAVAGRPVFDEADWDSASATEGDGGLAAQIIHGWYEREGVAALERLNGNYVVVLYDRPQKLVRLVTDSCGVLPVFQTEPREGWVYCSHPDVLADAANVGHLLDESSLAEFILSGTVTPPYSYYQRIRAADCGTVFTHNVGRSGSEQPAKRKYFEFRYRGDSAVPEENLAEELAVALRRAVRRRTHPRLGPAAVALSGGLDSRVVLASSLARDHTFAFCCYDEPNRELKTAAAIARALSVRFLPLQRSGEYYADNAELGVKISGGMGSFANNHFLGVIPRLKDEGMESLLTGCYCDYLFKALPLNRRVNWLTGREVLAPFRHDFYFDHAAASTPLAERARERWQSRIPAELQKEDDPAAMFEVETLRTFPLCYEGDNQQRLVPQRLTGWCPPAVDRDLIDVYCKLPYQFKLNRSVFRKAVVALGSSVRAVHDANTGTVPDASAAWEGFRRGQLRLQRGWRRLAGSAPDGSWPDWQQYVTHSQKLNDLWRRENPDAMDLFRRVLGATGLPDDLRPLKRRQPFLFVGLLTVKLWLEQRIS